MNEGRKPLRREENRMRSDRTLSFVAGAILLLSSAGCGSRQSTLPSGLIGTGSAAITPGNDAKAMLRGTGASLLVEAEDSGSGGYLDIATLPSGPNYSLAAADFAPVGVAIARSGKTAYAWYGQYYGPSKARFVWIDIATGKISHKLATTGCGGNIALTPDETAVVAADPCDTAMLVFSLKSRRIAAKVALTGLTNPSGIALDSTGKTAYVVGNSGMAIVDVPHARQIAAISLPGGTCWQDTIIGVALGNAGRNAYAATCDGSSKVPVIAVVDTRTRKLVQTIKVGPGAEWLADVIASPRHPYVYASVENSDGVDGEIVAINTHSNTVTKTESVHWSPEALAMSPNGNAVFATTWEGAVWYDVGPHGLKGQEHGPICCSTAEAGFGAFVH
jgi:DNA-binding beta-propeller fold protein YncE